MYIILFAGILSMVAVFFRFAGQLLVIDEPPRVVDAIVVLGGDKGERTQKGVELYKAGYAPLLVFSDGGWRGNLKNSEAMAQYAVKLGAPARACLTEEYSVDTYGNAYHSRKLMKEHSLKAAIVVSSPYHMRRARYVFTRLFEGSGIILIFVSAEPRNFDADLWWQRKSSRTLVCDEYMKFVWYIVRLELLRPVGLEWLGQESSKGISR